MAFYSECMPWCAQILLDTADIVGDGDFASPVAIYSGWAVTTR